MKSILAFALFVMASISALASVESANADTTKSPALQLVMVEEEGCMWCKRWHEEIGPIYPKSSEGKRAPLRRIDISDPVPKDMTIARRLHYTPTFVLLQDGVETGRIEGYPGEDFFWGLLSQILASTDKKNASSNN